ncbi:MAG: aldehyde dehydrogenase EutE [Acidobacteriota bacterium]|nr:aldehyde dehydrogenase EutE [Acidobacteriota bacterium]
MTPVDRREIQEIVRRVRRRYAAEDASVAVPPAGEGDQGYGVFDEVDDAVREAGVAFESFQTLGLDARVKIIDSVRAAMVGSARELAQMAHRETGLGRAEDKEVKNLLVTRKTPGPEDLAPAARTGDQGMTVTEYAPFGVIAAITPTTNPTATLINNAIATISAGNAVVFNAHPAAKSCSAETVHRINRAILAAGGPLNLATTVREPTIASAQELMHHQGVRILLVTGGPGVVKEALKTDKRAITAGPGNPPVVVDESADVERAAREIVRGASFDNNMVCTDEKEVLVVASRADELLRAFGRQRAVVLNEYQTGQIAKVVFEEPGAPGQPGRINRRWVGKNAGTILREIGIQASDDVRLAVAEVPVEHSLVWTEQMMPVMPVARVRTFDEAIDVAVRAEHQFRHTASIYSNNVDHITRMARAMNVSIFVANAANLAGLGEGGEDFTSYSIATPTGEGLTRPRTFSRIRRLTVAGSLRIV